MATKKIFPSIDTLSPSLGGVRTLAPVHMKHSVYVTPCLFYSGVSIDCLDEFFAIDISVPTTMQLETDDATLSSSSLSSVSKIPKAGALESAFQLLRLILTSFVFEEDAFKRGKQQVLHDYEHYTKDLVVGHSQKKNFHKKRTEGETDRERG